MKILVTGANGFVGSALCPFLREQGHEVVEATRATVGDLGPDTDWSTMLTGVEAVIHLAARVHVMDDRATDPLAAFRQVNVAGTHALACQAVDAGVKRLVFLSSIKVNGEETLPGQPFQAVQGTPPLDPYGLSKWEAEQALWEVGPRNGLEVTVVRPPLVYGPGVRANFLKLMGLVDKGIPLPFGAIDNARSLIGLDNLVSALETCVTAPGAEGQTFLVSDNEDVSTSKLVQTLAGSMGKSARLLSISPGLLKGVGALTGKSAAVSRLLGSLQVDSSAITRLTGWNPPLCFEEGIRKTVEWYKTRRNA